MGRLFAKGLVTLQFILATLATSPYKLIINKALCRNYYCFMAIAVVVSSCEPKAEKATEPDKRSVKSVLTSTHEPVVGNLDSFEYSPSVLEGSFISELLFNSEGKLLKESKFDADANLKSKAIFKYDGHGNNVQVDFYASSGSLLAKVTSRFSTSNSLIERIEVDAKDQLIRKQVVERNGDGNRIMMTYERTNGRLIRTLENIFDEKNQNVLNNYFNKESLKNKDVSIFDLNGDKIGAGYTLVSAGSSRTIPSAFEKDVSLVGGQQIGRTLTCSEAIEYDADGNRIEAIQYLPLTNRRTIVRYAYAKNRMEVAMLTGNLIVYSKKIVRYDNHNNILETFRFGIGGRLDEHQQHAYEYDQTGNWTKHKTIINNKPVSLVLRQIEYF